MSDQDSQTVQLEDFPRAGLLRRLAALLYDAFLVAAIWMLSGYIVVAIFGTDSNQVVDGRVQTNALQGYLLFSLMVSSSASFYLYFWMRSGQTLGMLAWRLRLENLDGSLLNLQQGILRFIAAWPSFICLGAGYLWLYLDPQGDSAHDRLCKTRVVVVPRSQRPF